MSSGQLIQETISFAYVQRELQEEPIRPEKLYHLQVMES